MSKQSTTGGRMKLPLLPSNPFVWVIEYISNISIGNQSNPIHPIGRKIGACHWHPVFGGRGEARTYAKACRMPRGAYRITKYVPAVKDTDKKLDSKTRR